MTQLFICVNIDKGEYVTPVDYGATMGIVEHANNRTFMRVIEELLHSRWNGDRIVWAGWFMDEYKYFGNIIKPSALEKAKKEKVDLRLYQFALEYFKRVTDVVNHEQIGGYQFFINHTKREYCDVYAHPARRYRDKNRVHPLPILLASGNGKKEGDYFGTSMRSVGYWAGDAITAQNEEPDDLVYMRHSPIFIPSNE